MGAISENKSQIIFIAKTGTKISKEELMKFHEIPSL